MKNVKAAGWYTGLCWLLFFLMACHSSQPPAQRLPGWATPVRNHIKNCYRLNDSIYRSAQPGATAASVLKDLKIKALLNLRSAHADPDFEKESSIRLYWVPMRARHIQDADIIAALKIIREAPKPLLVHCRYGADRTGAVLAMYRIVFCGWSREAAIDEMKNGDYHFHARYDNIPAYIQHADIATIKKAIFE